MCIRNATHRQNPKSWCRECSVSWSCASCGKSASETSGVPKDATCSDCSNVVTAYLARHSLQGVYLTKDNEKFYSECLEKLLLLKKSIDVTDRSFLRCTKEAVAHMHEAGQVLYTAVHRWIVSILARSATADVVATQPEYILLRSSSADSWGIKKYMLHSCQSRQSLLVC